MDKSSIISNIVSQTMGQIDPLVRSLMDNAPSFQADVKKAAKEFSDNDYPAANDYYYSNNDTRRAFIAGAQWARERGFQEACEMLRSDEANRLTWGGAAWAEWLEKQK